MFVKNGMGGSRCGRGRREGTEVLKADSKTARRRMDRQVVEEQVTPGNDVPSVYHPDLTDDDLEYFADFPWEDPMWNDWVEDDLSYREDDDYDYVQDYDLITDPFNCE